MANTFTVALDGAMLERGFWLYAWEATLPDGTSMLYVGRTGDSSSANAQSLFWRLGQNLGNMANTSMVRNNLTKRGVDPETCTYRMVGHGPVFEEVAGKDFEAHKLVRDKVAAMEKQLSEDLRDAGYDVMNVVRSKKPLDAAAYAPVRAAFAAEFPLMAAALK